eukprot:TRINITY_DN2441_c0_g1_i1.p1 TRINITY_DN2441_c0_g1~~TRINITY_DN2441_c0_g1_i1.p1  ORF type:complete len:343 (+),score=10.56 TRINITY_DN2441_c0_g1_i1:163-1191(+)
MITLLFIVYFTCLRIYLCEPVCENYSDYIYAGPKTHGKVHKRGILPTKLWWNVQPRTFIKQMREEINQQKLELPGNKLVQNGYLPQHPISIPMSEQCQVFISHKYKLIYVKLSGTAGTSLLTNFRRNCRTLNSTGEKECIDAEFVRPDVEQIPDGSTAQEMWKDYFVFTGIRNPYSRGASAYAYLLRRRSKAGTSSNEQCSNWPFFAQFCRAPFIVGMQTERYDCMPDKIHDYLHVEPQTRCLVNEYGQFVVDYILSMEELKEDYEVFKRELINRPDLTATQREYFRKFARLEYQHRNAAAGGSSYVQRFYQGCGDSCVENLAAYYSDDFNILGYENCIYKS